MPSLVNRHRDFLHGLSAVLCLACSIPSLGNSPCSDLGSCIFPKEWRLYTAKTENRKSGSFNCWDVTRLQVFGNSGCSSGEINVSLGMQMASGDTTGYILSNAFQASSGSAGLRSQDGDYGDPAVWIGVTNVIDPIRCIKLTQADTSVNKCRPASDYPVSIMRKLVSESTWQTIRVVTTIDGENKFDNLEIPTTTAGPTTMPMTTTIATTTEATLHLTTTTMATTMEATTTASGLGTTAIVTTSKFESRAFSAYLTMHVSNAAEFVKEPNVTSALRQAIAQVSEVAIEYVRNVNVKPKSRRLLEGSMALFGSTSKSSFRRVQDASGDVDVTWTIEIPPDAPDDITVTIVADRFDAKSISEITQTINTIINSGYLGSEYETEVLNVKWEYVIADATTAPSEPAATDDSISILVVVISISVFATVLAIVATACVAFRSASRTVRLDKLRENLQPTMKKEHLSEALRRIADSDVRDWLSPPEAISAKQAGDLQMLSQAIYQDSSFNSAVSICFSSGQRSTDATGYGPGSYFALAVAKSLHDSGVPCFCELMLKGNFLERRHAFRAHLKGKNPCKALIVLETSALFQDKEALEDIYLAQKNHIECLPLRMADDLPSPEDQWRCIEQNDLEGITMLAEVQVKFGKLNSIPSPPYTVPQQPTVLDDLVVDLKLKICDDLGIPDKKQIAPSVMGEFKLDQPQSQFARFNESLLRHCDYGKEEIAQSTDEAFEARETGKSHASRSHTHSKSTTSDECSTINNCASLPVGKARHGKSVHSHSESDIQKTFSVCTTKSSRSKSSSSRSRERHKSTSAAMKSVSHEASRDIHVRSPSSKSTKSVPTELFISPKESRRTKKDSRDGTPKRSKKNTVIA